MDKAKHYLLVIGTYTGPGASEGMYLYDFNADSGSVAPVGKSTPVSNPSFLAISKDEKFVYAVGEGGMGEGNIGAFKFMGDSLAFINSVKTGGSPCYVAVDSSRKVAFAANYGGGSIFGVSIREDGSLDTTGQFIQHGGEEGKKRAHAHSTVLSPDENYLIAADLGLDRLFVYKVDKNSKQPLTPAVPPAMPLDSGSGPRHTVFSPNGKYLYAVNELSGSVNAYTYDNGQLSFLNSVSMLPADFKGGAIEGADIHVSPDGNYVYASNREIQNEIIVCKVQPDGKIAFQSRHSVMGKAPRNFTLDPTGKFLLVANQNTNEVIVFNRDEATGELKFSGNKFALSKPVCLKFVPTPR